MAKYICLVCRYTHEGNEAPGRCPVCKSPSSQFSLVEDKYDGEDNNVSRVETNKGIKELQVIDDSQYNDQKVVEIEEEANSVDSGVSVEDSLIKIAETKGISYAIKWYKENNKCDTYEAIEAVKSICSQHKVYCTLEDKKEILKFGNAKLQAVKWYQEKHNCGLKEAKDVVDAVLDMTNVSSVTDKENDDTYPLNNEGNDIEKGKSGKKSCLIVIGVIVLLFIIGLLVKNEGSEQNKESNPADSIACVDSLETELDIKSPEYVKKYLEETLNQAQDESIERVLTKYFSKDFIKLYNEVEEIDNRTLESGELGFWDFDFWTGGQDGELQSVKVLEIKDMVGNSASAIVQYLIKFGDYDESKVSKEFQLLFESDEWRIDDFDNYKWRFKDYIDSSVSQQVEISDTIFADSVAVAE